MAETLRELVVALSLDSSNFSRNMRTINQQNKEAESTGRKPAIDESIALPGMAVQTQITEVLDTFPTIPVTQEADQILKEILTTEGNVVHYGSIEEFIRKPEAGCDAFFRLPSCKTIFRFSLQTSVPTNWNFFGSERSYNGQHLHIFTLVLYWFNQTVCPECLKGFS